METYYGIPEDQTALEVCVGIDAQLICILDADGLPQCWNDDVQLPADVSAAREQGPLHGLTCGFGHACALAESGEAVCWGDNQAGQAEPPGSFVRLAGDQATVEWYPNTRPEP